MPDRAPPPAPPTTPAHAGYFTGLASTYAQHRPTYPGEAIAYLLNGLPASCIAVDVGCGTGISSRLLAEHGVRVIGIDPNQDMLDQARRESPSSIEYRIGTGERTGMPDSCADLVLCAQSFHWFNPPTALREFHRVLKSRGRLALMWNVKDSGDVFSAGFIRNSDRAQADAATRGLKVNEHRAGDPTIGGFFQNVRMQAFAITQYLDLEGVLGRARSASYFPKSDPLRTELENDLRDLFKQHQCDGVVSLRYRTEVTLAVRVD